MPKTGLPPSVAVGEGLDRVVVLFGRALARFRVGVVPEITAGSVSLVLSKRRLGLAGQKVPMLAFDPASLCIPQTPTSSSSFMHPDRFVNPC